MRAALVVGCVLACTLAHADSDDIVSRPLVLERGQVQAQVVVESSLFRIGDPLSIAPDIWVGITDRLTLGITHSNTSVDRIAAGASFCTYDRSIECDETYNGSALDARWSWKEGAFAVAPRVRLWLRDIEPLKPAVTVGALLRWHHTRMMFASDPYLRIGLMNRDRGNRAHLSIPIWYGIQPTCRWLFALHVGWESDLEVWRDGWHGPLALLVKARVTPHLDASVEAGFSSLLGPQNNINQRVIAFALSWRT